MFNNIIYFIIVLLIFNISYPDNGHGKSLTFSLVMLFMCWAVFLFYCKLGFARLAYRYGKDGGAGSRLTNGYHSLVFRLSVLAVFLFSLDVYLFHLKYWLQAIPGVRQFSVLQGIFALTLFLFYLATIWYYSHPIYKLAYQTRIKRQSFIISNIKLNFPILFPWLILSLVFDLISLSPWSGPETFLNRTEGQMIFLPYLIIFIPDNI